MRTKDQVRRDVWKRMDAEGVSRFPGAEGRIPNFAGAKLAAEKLAGHRLWKRAQVIKVNPDSPQTHARRAALEEGKTLIMAVPRLRDAHPFRLLEPRKDRPLLSAREREVLQLICEGRRPAEIAARLFVSVTTVKSHRANAMRKLGARSTAELIRYAIRAGLASL